MERNNSHHEVAVFGVFPCSVLTNTAFARAKVFFEACIDFSGLLINSTDS